MQYSTLRFNVLLPRFSTCILFFFLVGFPVFNSQKPSQVSAPPQVQLLSPSDGSTTYASVDQPKALPRFQWNPVAGATAYRLEISADSSFDPAALLVEVPSTPLPSWTPVESNLPDGVLLYWRVRVEAQDGTTEKGEYSAAWSFYKDWRRTGPDLSALNAATLLLPLDGASLAFSDPAGDGSRPAFSWTPVLGATHYVFQAAQETDFDPLSYQETTSATTFQLAGKLADGEYYWRVVPMQAGDPPLTGDPGAYRQVKFDYHAQFLPQLLEPADQAEVTFNPTFHWTAVRGAQKYVLQYSTDSSFPAGQTTQVETYANRYTSPALVDNHTRYYWRVRVISGNSNAPAWTPYLSFDRVWGQKPALLTPANGFLYANDPLFTWAPVPGAAGYTLEVDDNAEFSSPLVANDLRVPFYAFPDPVNNCPPFPPDPEISEPMRVFWRVTALDASEQPGEPSEPWTFVCDPAAGAPVQVSPGVYYPPFTGLDAIPQTENTASLPVFLWKRVLFGAEKTQAAAYRVQVAETTDFTQASIRYTFDTENMHAAPAQAGLLPHGDGQKDYYWRVRPLASLDGQETGQWSQTWRMRYNLALLAAPTGVIQPLRPEAGSEWVETVPLFEWMPLQGATSYRIQISLDSNFDSLLGEYAADFPAYSHPCRLATGTYYWRVLGRNGTEQIGNWSDPIRFHIAAQSRWRSTRTPGANNSPVIATDPAGDAGDATYDLTSLSVTQGGSIWYFGFQANPGDNMRYAVYIDTNRIPGSGAVINPEDYDIAVNPVHLPEVAIYIDKINGNFNTNYARFYKWNSSSKVWYPGVLLSGMVGAGITYNSVSRYLEFTIRGSDMTQSADKNSLSVAVMSLPLERGRPQDSLPYDPDIIPGGSGSNQLDRFASVSDRVTRLAPSYRVDGDPLSFPAVPPFTWQPLVEVPEVSSYTLRVGTDSSLSNWLSAANQNNAAVFTFSEGIAGDAVYYWQVRPDYAPGSAYGGWSQAGSFEQKGAPALGFTITNDLWTPVLSWNMVTGAYSYEVEIDDEAGFLYPLVLSATTKMNTYIPDSVTFIDGKTYYARVRMYQAPLIPGMLSDSVAFTMPPQQVSGLRTIPETSAGAPAPSSPTFCWDSIGPAWKYLLEISTDASFATIMNNEDLTEQRCHTLLSGLLDGAFYWRVTAVDGSLKAGVPSIPTLYWKRYPAPTLISPTSQVEGTPLFTWAALEGADRYRLEISDRPNFAVIRYAVTTMNNEHQPVEKLDFSSYYWRVKMIDRDNIEGPFSEEYQTYQCFLPAIRR